MTTEKLYYEDAYMKSCKAKVLACRKTKKGYEIVLDRTCFYPEGGGQIGDRGRLGSVEVYDTQERDGEILHYTREPLVEGSEMEAFIDWQQRFDLMQQHSGEHMVSGVIHRRFGYENVGFHMGTDLVTIDLSGELSWEILLEVEEEVNRAIWKNSKVKIYIPKPKELANIPYRSKKELTGDVRIVEFPDMDICACCGTHVDYTGEIGLVKILSCEKFHEGTRVEMLCGERAMKYLVFVYEQNRMISRQLSAKPMETAKAVSKLLEEQNAKKTRIYELEQELFEAKARELSGRERALVFFDNLNADAIRRACDLIQKSCRKGVACFSGSDEEGYKYAIGLPDGELREFVKDMNKALGGRGGGKPFFVQGSVTAKREEIEKYFGQI